jgi:hypothetical protein
LKCGIQAPTAGLPAPDIPANLFRISTVAEIEAAIEKLPPEQQEKLRAWFEERRAADKPVLQKLRDLAGTGHDLAPDFASNHDHYLHGKAKRSAS